MTHTNTNTKTEAGKKRNKKIKCFKGSLYAIFFKSIGFKDFKFYIGYHLAMTMTQHTNTNTKTSRPCALGMSDPIMDHCNGPVS